MNVGDNYNRPKVSCLSNRAGKDWDDYGCGSTEENNETINRYTQFKQSYLLFSNEKLVRSGYYTRVWLETKRHAPISVMKGAR